MRIELASGLVIQSSPILPWDRRGCDLKIECGSAFHPRHVTSRLCLQLLDGCLPGSPCRVFLDVGCGSGILALAALRLGAAASVRVDIDPRAIHMARRNGVTNGLADRALWVLGSCSAVRGAFDCVAANLPVPVLVPHLTELASNVNPGGRLVLSGFYDTEEQAFRVMLARIGFAVEYSIRGDLSFAELPPAFSHTWIAMSATRTA